MFEEATPPPPKTPEVRPVPDSPPTPDEGEVAGDSKAKPVKYYEVSPNIVGLPSFRLCVWATRSPPSVPMPSAESVNSDYDAQAESMALSVLAAFAEVSTSTIGGQAFPRQIDEADRLYHHGYRLRYCGPRHTVIDLAKTVDADKVTRLLETGEVGFRPIAMVHVQYGNAVSTMLLCRSRFLSTLREACSVQSVLALAFGAPPCGVLTGLTAGLSIAQCALSAGPGMISSNLSLQVLVNDGPRTPVRLCPLPRLPVAGSGPAPTYAAPPTELGDFKRSDGTTIKSAPVWKRVRGNILHATTTAAWAFPASLFQESELQMHDAEDGLPPRPVAMNREQLKARVIRAAQDEGMDPSLQEQVADHVCGILGITDRKTLACYAEATVKLLNALLRSTAFKGRKDPPLQRLLRFTLTPHQELNDPELRAAVPDMASIARQGQPIFNFNAIVENGKILGLRTPAAIALLEPALGEDKDDPRTPAARGRLISSAVAQTPATVVRKAAAIVGGPASPGGSPVTSQVLKLLPPLSPSASAASDDLSLPDPSPAAAAPPTPPAPPTPDTAPAPRPGFSVVRRSVTEAKSAAAPVQHHEDELRARMLQFAERRSTVASFSPVLARPAPKTGGFLSELSAVLARRGYIEESDDDDDEEDWSED